MSDSKKPSGDTAEPRQLHSTRLTVLQRAPPDFPPYCRLFGPEPEFERPPRLRSTLSLPVFNQLIAGLNGPADNDQTDRAASNSPVGRGLRFDRGYSGTDDCHASNGQAQMHRQQGGAYPMERTPSFQHQLPSPKHTPKGPTMAFRDPFPVRSTLAGSTTQNHGPLPSFQAFLAGVGANADEERRDSNGSPPRFAQNSGYRMNDHQTHEYQSNRHPANGYQSPASLSNSPQSAGDQPCGSQSNGCQSTCPRCCQSNCSQSKCYKSSCPQPNGYQSNGHQPHSSQSTAHQLNGYQPNGHQSTAHQSSYGRGMSDPRQPRRRLNGFQLNGLASPSELNDYTYYSVDDLQSNGHHGNGYSVNGHQANGFQSNGYPPNGYHPNGPTSPHSSPQQRKSSDSLHHADAGPHQHHGHGMDKKRKRRGNLPKPVTKRLTKWLNDHLFHPYPTEDEKQFLMIKTGLQMNQISNWFINARRRQVPDLLRQYEQQRATLAATATAASNVAQGQSPAEEPDEPVPEPYDSDEEQSNE